MYVPGLTRDGMGGVVDAVGKLGVPAPIREVFEIENLGGRRVGSGDHRGRKLVELAGGGAYEQDGVGGLGGGALLIEHAGEQVDVAGAAAQRFDGNRAQLDV